MCKSFSKSVAVCNASTIVLSDKILRYDYVSRRLCIYHVLCEKKNACTDPWCARLQCGRDRKVSAGRTIAMWAKKTTNDKWIRTPRDARPTVAAAAVPPTGPRLDGRVCPPIAAARALRSAAAVLINYYSTELDFNALLLWCSFVTVNRGLRVSPRRRPATPRKRI